MLPCYVLLDLETTGGNPVIDRITEIAAVRIENGQEVARWSTLVNPGCSISPFIQHLTGISNAMVRGAPGFETVAQHLLALLDGAVLVAHNVRFDHGFLQSELARLDVALRVKTLCTVRLSRRLYPQHKGHGLDAIMQRHGIRTLERHRAMGDVAVMQAWLQIARQEHGAELLGQQALALLQASATLPPQLESRVADIPESVGVYIFYGEGPLPLYIGKSINLRSRVLAHFQAASRAPREMRMAQEIRRIEWLETAGEIGALLLEARLVKEKRPAYNRQPRLQLALAQQKLLVWPYPGKVGLREYNARSERTDIHIFDQWCHLATVQDDGELTDALGSRSTLAFDLDTYRLLLKHIAAPGKGKFELIDWTEKQQQALNSL
ncbi:MAG: DNA polymerase III subunit epsilon [Rhodoferax sp. RIFCSPLOWO2_12_FULL_60_11]|nr:MAG: DNA polymerase III subunit epsilon [Rhodoferax sp. RIFCSPLOWO2_12_FULL_60_11]